MGDARVAQLASVIETVVATATSGLATVAFSGGVDSSLVAMLASRHAEIELLVVGTPGAHDLAAAEESAALLDLNIRRLEISPTQMVAASQELAATLRLSQQEVEFLLPFWLVAREATHKLLHCGQGADELCGGYDRFRRDGGVREYVGRYDYKLVNGDGGLKIAERRAVLDSTELGELGAVSFIL